MKKTLLVLICVFFSQFVFAQDFIQNQKKKRAAIDKRVSGTFELNWVSYMMYESSVFNESNPLQQFAGLDPSIYINVHTTYNSWLSIGAKSSGLFNYANMQEDIYFVTSASVPVLFNFTFDAYDYTKLASQQSPYDGFGISAGAYYGAWNRLNYRNSDLTLETLEMDSGNMGGIVEIFFGSRDFMLKLSAMKDITNLTYTANDNLKRLYLGFSTSYMF
jgi:hypothetical protein